MAGQNAEACSSATSAGQRPMCAICYEDLRPVVELLQCVPGCGHVFHELCLQQWLEYCPSGKTPTCPMCKQSCGTRNKPARLYFQSTATDGGSSQPSSAVGPSHSFDAEKLTEEVARLEKKNLALTEIVEAMKFHNKKLTEEIQASQELMKNEKTQLEDFKREKQDIQRLLNVKVEEVSRKTVECNKLQEKSLALAKELAAIKLATDMNLGEEEIMKFAHLGHSNNPENAVDVLKRSLAMRNKSYKELMTQCNILGRSESRLQQKLEKAKDQIKKLKTQLLELEKENEEKENAMLRDLKHSKKTKVEGTCTTFMKSCTVEAINLEDDPDIMDNKELLGSKPRAINNTVTFLNKKLTTEHLGIAQNTSPFESNNAEDNYNREKSVEPLTSSGSKWVKGISLIEGIGKQSTSIAVPQNEVQIHKPNSSLDNLHPIWATGTEGINRSSSKWCKRDGNTQANGDLIAVGPDGRGGTVKVLRSVNQFQVAQSKTPASRSQQKVGAKGSQFQIEHFFSKK